MQAPMPMLNEFGNLHREAEMEDATDLLSSEIKPINNDCSVGLDIVIRQLLVMKTADATGKLGLNGMENRKAVEDACVRTMVLTVPNLLASLGVARFAKPITRLFIPPKIGPLTSSFTPNLR